MRRLLLFGLSLLVTTAALSQETQVREHPTGTSSNFSAYRYDHRPYVEPPGCINSRIPLCETRSKLNDIVESPILSKRVTNWVEEVLPGMQGLNSEDVFVTYMEISRDNMGPPHFGHYNGNDMQYASSFAKAFYATALYYELQQEKIKMTDALRGDVKEMLHHNDNAAANRVMDYLTGTSSGPALGYPEFCQFAKKRDYVNWMFVNVGFENFNINQKVWTESPSPRDLQLLDEKYPLNYSNSNRVTTNQMAALLYLIDQECIISHQACQDLKAYMFRPLEQEKIGPLPGIANELPVGSKMVSIKGYTAHNYSDAAVITLPNHQHYVLVVMTKYNDNPTLFIPMLSKIVAKRMMTKTGDDEPNDYLHARPLTGQ